MQINDFSILGIECGELADFGIHAGAYAQTDPQMSAVKLRCFAEKMVDILYEKLIIDTDSENTFFERLTNENFKKAIEKTNDNNEGTARKLINKLHLLRVYGNKAAHAEQISCETASSLVNVAFELAQWLKNTLSGKIYTDIAYYAEDVKQIAEKIELPEFFNNTYQFNSDQSNLINELCLFFRNKTYHVFLLKGYAGTGKTFIIKTLKEFLDFQRIPTLIAAPTGKATRVVAHKMKSNASTIHSLIYLIENLKVIPADQKNDKTYKLKAELRANTQSSNTVYIIDEASMVSNVEQHGEFILFGSGYLLDDLIRFVNIDNNIHNKKIIFVGDNAQLPPINMKFSPALDASYLEEKFALKCHEYELREIVRQKVDSGIIKNSLLLRDALSANKFYKLNIDTSLPDTVHINYGDFVPTYLTVGKNDMFSNSIMIVSTNADAMAYNQDVREVLFPNCKHIAVGDKLLVVKNSYIDGRLFFNGDFVFVKSCENTTETRKIPIKNMGETIIIELVFRKIAIEFVDIENKNVMVNTYIIENLLYSSDSTLVSEEEKALFIDFCIRYPKLKENSAEFKDAITNDPYFNALRVKFGYVITCHKAQGSEWEHVFVKCKTYHPSVLSAGYFRWLYTALTRAASTLYLLDEPQKKIGSGMKVL